jgi:hypothetical protein
MEPKFPDGTHVYAVETSADKLEYGKAYFFKSAGRSFFKYFAGLRGGTLRFWNEGRTEPISIKRSSIEAIYKSEYIMHRVNGTMPTAEFEGILDALMQTLRDMPDGLAIASRQVDKLSRIFRSAASIRGNNPIYRLLAIIRSLGLVTGRAFAEYVLDGLRIEKQRSQTGHSLAPKACNQKGKRLIPAATAA